MNGSLTQVRKRWKELIGELLSELAVARLISENLLEGGALFLGNSMPIRDMDRYGAPGGNPVRVGVNRGASGIDSTLATAVGYARGTGVTESAQDEPRG